MNYSIVIPVFKRSEIIKNCLLSIENQSQLPLEVILVDNNTEIKETEKLNLLISEFKKNTSLRIVLLKSYKNSSSIARNIGAKKARSDLIAFLDSDVILNQDYYEIILKYFRNDPNLIAAQGLDISMLDAHEKSKNLSLQLKFLHFFEQIFQTSTLLNRNGAYVSPSLAVAHPRVDSDFEVDSQWISTCAGVFKRYLFDKYFFPENFVTYSNNEYLYFSYKLFKDKVGKMLYTSKAKYRDIQTNSGRLSFIPLLYQIEVNDLFIFLQLFKKNFLNISIYLFSRIGHLIYNLLKLIFKKGLMNINIFHIFFAILYPFIHIKEILNGDLTFYERDFPSL